MEIEDEKKQGESLLSILSVASALHGALAAWLNDKRFVRQPSRP